MWAHANGQAKGERFRNLRDLNVVIYLDTSGCTLPMTTPRVLKGSLPSPVVSGGYEKRHHVVRRKNKKETRKKERGNRRRKAASTPSPYIAVVYNNCAETPNRPLFLTVVRACFHRRIFSPFTPFGQSTMKHNIQHLSQTPRLLDRLWTAAYSLLKAILFG